MGWAAAGFAAWIVAYLAETAVPGMKTSQVGSAIIASTVFAGLAAWIGWGLWLAARMARNAWRDRASLPGRLLTAAVWGVGVTAALSVVSWLDRVVGPLPSGVTYRQWLGGVLVWAVAGALFLFAAYWIIRSAYWITAATGGLALIAPLLICGTFAVGWAPLAWVLVIASGVVLGGLVLGTLARA
jgi:hypothetical protein